MILTDEDIVRLTRDLRALRGGTRLPWSRVGEILDMAASSGYWQREGARSFTEWIRALAGLLGYRESSLWRYRSAVREYRRVSKELRRLEMEIPSLEALPDSVSPENIELLSKLARVAPPDVVDALTKRVVRGKISRDELRQTWRTFRPVLRGETARGRGGRRPQINRRDPQQYESFLEAAIFNGLEVSTGSWTGHEDPQVYKVFTHVRLELVPATDLDIVFDVVVVIRTVRGPLEIHGLECVEAGGSAGSLDAKLAQRSQCCDYLWLVGHEEAHSVHPDQVPVAVGLALVKGGEVAVARPAAPTPRPVRYREAMLSSLLTMALIG